MMTGLQDIYCAEIYLLINVHLLITGVSAEQNIHNTQMKEYNYWKSLVQTVLKQHVRTQ